MLSPMSRRTTRLLVAVVLACSACSSDSSADNTTTTAATPATAGPAATTPATEAPAITPATEAPATTPTTDAPNTEPATTEPATTDSVAPAPLEVLVTNDDGYAAAGIDAVVEYLRTRSDVHVTVVAPLENQSGAGDKATPAALAATDVTTASGYPAKAVPGFPADSVNWALDGGVPITFGLVISGSNLGQNYGPLTAISGTVGAAATAARRGIPAIAISQGFPADGASFDFPSSVAVLTAYLDDSIDDYRNGVAPALVSINVPTCPAGVAPLAPLEIASAASDNGRQLGAPTACDGNPAKPADDIDAFNAGHPTISELDPVTLAAA